MRRSEFAVLVAALIVMILAAFVMPSRAETEWRWRAYFFIRAVDATAQNKNTLAQIYVDHGGMEIPVNELKMFTAPVKLSTTGELPAQAFGFNSPVKLEMRDDFKALLDTLTGARYGIVRYDDLGLVLTNFPGIAPTGQVVTWETALQRLNAEFGLQVIQPETGP